LKKIEKPSEADWQFPAAHHGRQCIFMPSGLITYQRGPHRAVAGDAAVGPDRTLVRNEPSTRREAPASEKARALLDEKFSTCSSM